MEEEKKETEVELGTLYSINKNIVQNAETKLPEGVLNSKKEELRNYLRRTKNKYYMLLCNDRKDFTIFTLGYENYYTIEDKYDCLINVLIDECLSNRGEIRGFDITKDKEAIEIWISMDGDSYAYYFFPYDNAIIEIEEEMEDKYEQNSNSIL